MLLKCPTCEIALVPRSVDSVVVDQCESCSGTWYEASELSSILCNAVDHASPRLPGLAPPKSISCPQCNVEISASIYANDSGIPICKCIRCKGVWLVDGQLEKIAHFRNGEHLTDRLGQAMADSYVESAWFDKYAVVLQYRMYSLVFAVVILGVAFVGGGPESSVRLLALLLLPMACIWFSDAMRNLSGIRMGLVRPSISQPTPGIAIAIGGWFLLLAVFGMMVYAGFVR